MPDLRLPEARGDQCDNCGNQLDPTELINPRSKIDGSTPEFRETNAPLPRPAAVRRRAEELDRVAARLAPERPELLARAGRRHPAASDDARPRLGRAHSGPRLRRGPEQADLRLVRRGDRLPVGEHRVGARARRTGGLARLVADRGRNARVLPGEGQHRLPHRHLAGDPARLRRRRRGRRPAGRSTCQTTSSPPST